MKCCFEGGSCSDHGYDSYVESIALGTIIRKYVIAMQEEKLTTQRKVYNQPTGYKPIIGENKMGIISSIKAMKAIETMKRGGKAKISYAQISTIIINLMDAKKKFDSDTFNQIFSLYKEFQTYKSLFEVDLNGYYLMAFDIIKEFDKIAPFEKYCGGSELEYSVLLEEIRNLDNDIEKDIDTYPKDDSGETIPFNAYKSEVHVVSTENNNMTDALSFKKGTNLSKEMNLSKENKPVDDIKNVNIAQHSKESGFSDIINPLNSVPRKRDKTKPILIILLVVSILLSGIIVFHYEQEKNVLLEGKSSLEKEIASMEKEVASLKKKVSKLDDKADNYNQIIKTLDKGNVGYAANYFKLNKGILYLSPGEKEKVTLTTTWSSRVTVYHENSSDKVASIKFNEDSWYDYTTLTIEAKKEGVSIITLSNSIDSKKIRLIVVVD